MRKLIGLAAMLASIVAMPAVAVDTCPRGWVLDATKSPPRCSKDDEYWRAKRAGKDCRLAVVKQYSTWGSCVADTGMPADHPKHGDEITLKDTRSSAKQGGRMVGERQLACRDGKIERLSRHCYMPGSAEDPAMGASAPLKR